MSAPLCKFFAQGRCAFGTACNLSHGTPAPSKPSDGYAKGNQEPAVPVNAGTSSASSGLPREKRIDPEDGELRTYSQIKRRYSGFYPDSEVERYWQEECLPVPEEESGAKAPPSLDSNSDLSALPAELVVQTFQDGWCVATLSSAVPLPAGEDLQRTVSQLLYGGRALGVALESVQKAVPGIECRVDLASLSATLVLPEQRFLEAGRSGSEGKEELKLDKKLREISNLRKRQCAGEALDKLQTDKLSKCRELFHQVAELKFRRAWSELGSALAQHMPRFQDGCSETEWLTAQSYGDASTASGGSTPLIYGGPEEVEPPLAVPGGASNLCRHFLMGRCTFGDSCRLSHGEPSGAPPRPPPRRPTRSAEPELAECGICFENVLKKGERFGMLEHCDHAFCLSCIRGWRREREQQDRHNLRLCPVCRNESFYVIPCDTLILDPDEKSRAIEQYKKEMGRIPCKLFDYGRGTCPFGTSCFYAHLNPDGTRHIPAPLKWMAGAEGKEVRGEVKLSDFFD